MASPCIHLPRSKLDFDEIKIMFIADWHRTATLGQPTPKINKISGVQQKKKDPNWKKGKGKDNSKSESPGSPSPSNDSKPSSGKKFRGGRRTKKKVALVTEEANEDKPSHILSFAASAMVPQYASTISTIDSRPSVPPQKYQGTPTKGAWETVPEAISLLHRMGIKPSIQTMTHHQIAISEKTMSHQQTDSDGSDYKSEPSEKPEDGNDSEHYSDEDKSGDENDLQDSGSDGPHTEEHEHHSDAEENNEANYTSEEPERPPTPPLR
ncbi:hypothetical protein AMATHDRAFT_9628 [Amanita thiersii Skay4041]|uniref:Uncharacterized protein n=1 Tax=Amanita thiersii Skay4041 TaxID=703135 RepID=A0A2A9NC36_9AGAR|nr:hypothetical protein AMATHDRAFT_9628 [Amanita thiersii Skay4041]